MDTLRPSLFHNTLTGYAPAAGSNRTSTRSALHSTLRIVHLLDRRTRALLGASRLGFSVAASATLLLFYNLQFWRESLQALGGAAAGSVSFLVALGAILITLHALILYALPGRRTAPVVAAALFMLAAIIAYFGNTYGAYFDAAMMRNIFDSDQSEMRDLLKGQFFAHLALCGILPASLVARVRVPAQSWSMRWRRNAGIAVAGLALVAALALSFSAHFASFLREHKPLRYLINPANVIYGAAHYAWRSSEDTQAFEDTEGRVIPVVGARGAKPLLVFLVIGETARAANFELDGYARHTNPRLRRMDNVLFFRDVHSCGTSTATSVPCMFSHLGRSDFDVDAARSRSNLLDAVGRGGVSIQWRENNSGCKHVCDRVAQVDFVGGAQGDCSRAHCFDSVMLQGLREQLRDTPKNSLIVFHQAGSHGPAYAERYPQHFETFTPVCRSADLGSCARAAVVNAYDNTIVYTDHVLAESIELLKSLGGQYDSLLIYVSDHGESLGEHGLYLHAAPYFIAPEEQIHVPLVMWMSEGYRTRSKTDLACLRTRTSQPATHDDVYHTVLGALGLRSDVYRRDLDLLATCRAQW